MARVEVNGIGIAYDIIGTGDRSIAITAGGRFSRDTPGLRGLAEQLAGEGNRVLIWDRPNCGESDFCFSGESESITNVGVLGALLKELDFGPTLLVGGSAGSRLSLMTAIRYPESVSGLYLLWISGGWLGLAVLANH
ncbi:MAG: alpha/beta hydrolase, partial [Sphingomonadaceae bacterium]|nr:alpha/beta hydrolase [Sphingomonadaceae bacterium]